MNRRMTVGRVLCVTALYLFVPSLLAAGQSSRGTPLVGEVREFVFVSGNDGVTARLHHDGWLEADGRVLPAGRFATLYKTIGRAWTPASVNSDWFAVPDLRDRLRGTMSSDNPFGVLGSGDLVTSGEPSQRGLRSGPSSYWIYTGQDLSRVTNVAAPR
jgi:hypothetical protein